MSGTALRRWAAAVSVLVVLSGCTTARDEPEPDDQAAPAAGALPAATTPATPATTAPATTAPATTAPATTAAVTEPAPVATRSTGPGITVAPDPQGDVAVEGGGDAPSVAAGALDRADILEATVGYGEELVLEARLADAVPPERWHPIDAVTWWLDTTGDGRVDEVAEIRRYKPGPRAEIRRHRPGRLGRLRCEGRVSHDGSAYRLSVPPDCVGAPGRVSAAVTATVFDQRTQTTFTDRSPDGEEWLGPVVRSP